MQLSIYYMDFRLCREKMFLRSAWCSLEHEKITVLASGFKFREWKVSETSHHLLYSTVFQSVVSGDSQSVFVCRWPNDDHLCGSSRPMSVLGCGCQSWIWHTSIFCSCLEHVCAELFDRRFNLSFSLAQLGTQRTNPWNWAVCAIAYPRCMLTYVIDLFTVFIAIWSKLCPLQLTSEHVLKLDFIPVKLCITFFFLL